MGKLQELLTLPEHLSSSPFFCGVRVNATFVLFLLAIVLSVLLRYTDSDCPFGIFKLLYILHMQVLLECCYI
jgi:hypothetical protein